MKQIILPISILVLVFTVVMVNQAVLFSTTKKLRAQLSLSITAAEINDMGASKRELDMFIKQYEKVIAYFSMVTRHNEIDEMSSLIKKIEMYNILDEKNLFITDASTLLYMLEHIYKIDTICPENIV